MDSVKKTGAVMEFIGMLGAIVLLVFIGLNWIISANGGMPLIYLSPGDEVVALLATAVLIYFSGHLMHDHSHNPQQTDEQSNTAR